MHVGITGANGFIGRNLVWYLSDCGIRTTPLVGDVTQPNFMDGAPETLTAIIHCAGVNRTDDEQYMLSVNALGTYNAAIYCMKKGIRLLVTGTIKTEGMYGASKRIAQNIVTSLGDVGLDGAYLKLCNVYGPMAKPYYNSFASTILWCIANGKPYKYLIHDPSKRVALIHVRDVCQNIEGLLHMQSVAIGGAQDFERSSRVIDFCLATDFNIKLEDFVRIAEGDRPSEPISHRNVSLIRSTLEWYSKHVESAS